jgi:hypothetical protein
MGMMEVLELARGETAGAYLISATR